MTEVELSYTGALADQHTLDFYDAARALTGFQRSLALVTHLVLNGEVITQAPALKNASIVIEAPAEGSWRTKAILVLGGLWAVTTAGKDSPAGQVVTSVYDYVLSETMGFHVDYDKTLQQQYHEHLKQVGVNKNKIESLMEKSESSIADMHRPITASKTATDAQIYEIIRGKRVRHLGPAMNPITADYIWTTVKSQNTSTLIGVVTSYNINTFQGRILTFDDARPVPFELMEIAKRPRVISQITKSLQLNSANRSDQSAIIELTVHKLESSTGKLKRFHVVDAKKSDLAP